MRKIIFTQVMTTNGTASFSGLYDENGLPVKVELEKDDEVVVLTAVRRKLTNEELMEICNSCGDCDECVFGGDCDDEGGGIE